MAAEDANIKRLLEAEREAQEIVSEARKHRNDKLKQAKIEAERDIAAYRAEREEAYTKKMSEGSSNIEDTRGQLDAETAKTTSSIKSSLPGKKKDVVKSLMDYVLKVQ